MLSQLKVKNISNFPFTDAKISSPMLVRRDFMEKWSIRNNYVVLDGLPCLDYHKINDYFKNLENPRPEELSTTKFALNVWTIRLFFRHERNQNEIDDDYFITAEASYGPPQLGQSFELSFSSLKDSNSWLSEDLKKWRPSNQAQRDEILSLAERCGIKNFGVVKSESFFKFYEELDRSHFQESHIIDDDLFDPELIKMVEKEMPKNLRKETPDGQPVELYDYQKDGLGWLRYLDVSNRGGVLADEMGLGKTVQVISLICDEDFRNRLKKPSLIVVRASLVENWIREFKKFADEEIKVKKNSGPSRTTLKSELMEYDAIITTYDSVVNDISALEEMEWNAVILDEAHRIKNPDTARFGAMSRLNSRIRICMTGTPYQTHLLDMWSLGSFVNPGGMGPRDEWDEGEMDRAEAEVNFKGMMLKREVETVMGSLPEMIKLDTPLVMPSVEREHYNCIRDQVREEFERASGLVEITPLRQFCAHPQSVSEQYLSQIRETVKYNRLNEIINEIKFKNEKAVIFSAYNTLSKDIIKNDIEKDPNVFCELINGYTPDDERQYIIDRWGDFDGPAFIVANPDAAGEGLNMVHGNHVIHYTLEWNPAKQEQATKRVHRIGQEKPVFVHRLYYVDTVEEIQIEALEGRLETASEVIRESILDQFRNKNN